MCPTKYGETRQVLLVEQGLSLLPEHLMSHPVYSGARVALSGEATNTNCIVFGLTRPGVEPTIYHTRSEHANHYTIDAVTIYDINPVTILLNLKSGKIPIINEQIIPHEYGSVVV
jgi:hypothetical protein